MPRKMDDGSVSNKSHQHHTPSRIPAPKTGRYQVKNIENGYEKGETGSKTGASNTSGKRFETFVMTGDMIIQTTSTHHKPEIVKESPTQKRKRELKHSPVLVKRDGRSNITKPGDSPKASPKRKAPQRAVIESPKASPKKVVHSPQAPRKEPEGPKGSPKGENRKSPVRQSRLPRFTPKNSPKLSQKQSVSAIEDVLTSEQSNNVEKRNTITNKGNLASANNSNFLEKDSSIVTIDTNGAPPPHLNHPADKKQSGLELLGYPRFPDVPVELDIPPDDISSEDEKFKHETMVDIDDLPPPPEEFFAPESAVTEEQQPLGHILEYPNPSIPDNLGSEVNPVESNIDLQVVETVTPRSVEVGESLPKVAEADLEQNCDPNSEMAEHDTAGVCSQQTDTRVTTSDTQRSEHIMGTETGIIGDGATTSGRQPLQECISRDLELSGNVSPMHQNLTLSRTDSTMADRDSQILMSDSSDPMVSVETSAPCSYNTGSPAHHERSASVSDSSAIDSSTVSISSDSKVEVHKGSPNRTIVVSKSAEKIASNKTSSSSSNKNISDNLVVRCSKSHENYLERNEVITFVDIDLEENMASSVDALHHGKSSSSLESLNYVQFHEQSHSEGTSPDKHLEKAPGERKLMPTFINLEEARSITKLKEGAKLRDFSKSRSDAQAANQTSPSKSKRTEDKKTPESSPSHGKISAIPIRDSSSSRPPRSPKTLLPKQSKNPDSQQTVSTAKTNSMAPESSADKETVIADDIDITSPIIESPIQNASSHVVHADLPTEAEPPIATSSAPLSPGPEDANEGPDVPHECQKQCDQHSPESEKDFSLYHQPLKEIDRPSAARLAKRLFQLDGFKKGDITRHLCKKNDFSYLVGEEYLKFFNFTGMTLDQALRNFLKNLTLAGETQERERVLAHFSRRYLEDNPGSFNSEDACHTLVCALMLLNTDLHGQNIGRKMTVNEFIENLADLNDGENFPKEILKNLYHSIKTEPLECHLEDEHDSEASAQAQRAGLSQEAQRYIGHNPFLDIPDPSKTTEYKKGYVMRKCCVNADGRKTPMGKRGWKMFFATLKDMVLYLHKDDHGFKKNTMVASAANAIRIHHALAFRATDYKKKQHVFRLQTADWAQYLFQTSNSKECQEWIDTINFVAASLSAPPLPGGCGSQRKFERPLLPASYTRLNMREQAQYHEQRMLQVEQELLEHRKYPPEKGVKSRFIQDYMEKEVYLQFELKRFKVYSALLQMKLATFPELEPSLVEVAIGEVDEPSSLPSSPEQPRVIPLEADLATEQNTASLSSPAVPTSDHNRSSKPVQRSMSDRLQLEKCSNSPGDEVLLANPQTSPTSRIFQASAIPGQPPMWAGSKLERPHESASKTQMPLLHTFETQV